MSAQSATHFLSAAFCDLPLMVSTPEFSCRLQNQD
jgi:hypothetical protein